ncbi:bacteriophage lambda tail assembly I [[Actinobacillus] rossii]|uniref:Bacteriophage lambda tail assembly I n=1 Tax=[Actinobacillus] rossii TaxID=123820 RepID=A0A380TXI4_9PAST|nr:bacteriophage lambda tail assembly I [[Actinobacillus] rossii]
MVNVKFYGNLKRFGTEFKFEVKDTAEAIRALCSQIKGFRQVLQQGYYKVRIGRDYLNPEALEKGLFYCLKDGQTVHFTPVIKGAKSGGVFQTILGVALIGASFFIPPAGLLGGVITQAGVFGMGVALTLGGVSQMLTKTPTMGEVDDKEKKQSTSFSNLGNLVAQGRPVPLAYGQILTGSLVISQGVETFDVEEEMKNPKKQSKGFNKG